MTFAFAYAKCARFSLPSEDKLRALWATCEAVVGVPGDAAELGVYRGGTTWLMAMACPSRMVRAFDTFTGIPWDGYDPERDGHHPGEFLASLDEVRGRLAELPNVTFHPGLFPRTAVDSVYAIVHLDSDLYASTVAGLEWLWPRLSSGGAIVLDDWRWPKCPGVTRAVEEYFAGRSDYRQAEMAPHQLTILKR